MQALLQQWTPEEEATIWQSALFVFDTSTLLNFYEFSNTTRKDIYNNIFPLLKDRLWVTNHTEYEFLKHRDKVMNAPEQLYKEIREKHFLNKNLKDFTQQYEQLKTRTSKVSRHPYVDKDTFKGFDKVIDELTKEVSLLENTLNLQIEQRLKEHSESLSSDPLLGFFQISTGYSFAQLMEIAKEGEIRYRLRIPPGFADEKEKDDLGISKFGDLIIWKQMIDLAKQGKRPVILVTDDLKSDWYISDKNQKRAPLGPRHELIKEMQDEGGVTFWAYNSSQFLYKARQILSSPIKTKSIEEAEELVDNAFVVEDAVFRWAKARFPADSTIWPSNFWRQDTGADIIQTLDGAAFAIQIKRVSRRIRLKDLYADIEQINKIKEEGEYEGYILVLVSDSPQTSQIVKDLIDGQLPEFEIYTGYINADGNFVENGKLFIEK